MEKNGIGGGGTEKWWQGLAWAFLKNCLLNGGGDEKYP